jgi:hypothetical protein
MLNDADPWPVMCTVCGHKTQHAIGRLAKTFDFICVQCGGKFTFENQTFTRSVEHHRSNVRTAQGKDVFLTKRP